MAKANKRVLFGYRLNYLIDIKHAVIVDVEATPARTYGEVDATKTMLERIERRFRHQAKTARGRHGLWYRPLSRLAGEKEDHAAHPAVGQVRSVSTP
jgi:hypothetical protein